MISHVSSTVSTLMDVWIILFKYHKTFSVGLSFTCASSASISVVAGTL